MGCGSPSIGLRQAYLTGGPLTVEVESFVFYTYSVSYSASSGACDGLAGIACDDYDPELDGVTISTDLALSENPPGGGSDLTVAYNDNNQSLVFLLLHPSSEGVYKISAQSAGTVTTTGGSSASDTLDTIFEVTVVPTDTTIPRLSLQDSYSDPSQIGEGVTDDSFEHASSYGASLFEPETPVEVSWLFGSDDVDYLILEAGGKAYQSPFSPHATNLYSPGALFEDLDNDGIDEIYLHIAWPPIAYRELFEISNYYYKLKISDAE